MNIGVVTYSLSERSGARAPIRLAQHFRRKGHEVTIYAFDFGLDQNLFQSLKKEKIDLVIYKVNKSKFSPFPLRGFFSILKASQDFRKATHKVISFHSTFPLLLAAKLSGKRILTTYYGM